MSGEKRPYQKRHRAELEARTRQRITDSVIALHGTLGPSRTSLSAVARHAGVRRSTLYRHFPDEIALFTACTSHWMARNPLPDLRRWAEIEVPVDRLAAALSEMYAFYRRTERMLENIMRDEETMPIVKQMFRDFRDYISLAHETLMAGREGNRRTGRLASAAIGHALAFATWRSLTREQGLDDPAAVDLMCRLVAAAESPGSAAGSTEAESRFESLRIPR